MGKHKMIARRLLLSLVPVLLLGACASPAPKTQGTAGSGNPSAVQLTSKPPADPNVAATFAVAPADPASASAPAQSAASAIAKRIAGCWKGPLAPDAPAVELELTLAQDGSVSAVETIDKKRFAAEAGYRASAAAATRALIQCAPFALPASEYVTWKSLALKLTPRHV
jgi:hypothetical protein